MFSGCSLPSKCLPNPLTGSTGCFQVRRLCWKRGIKLTTSSLKNTLIRNWISWHKRNVFSWSSSSSGNWRNFVTSSNLRCPRQLKEQPSCTTNGFTSTNPPWITTQKKSCKWRIQVGWKSTCIPVGTVNKAICKHKNYFKESRCSDAHISKDKSGVRLIVLKKFIAILIYVLKKF